MSQEEQQKPKLPALSLSVEGDGRNFATRSAEMIELPGGGSAIRHDLSHQQAHAIIATLEELMAPTDQEMEALAESLRSWVDIERGTGKGAYFVSGHGGQQLRHLLNKLWARKRDSR